MTPLFRIIIARVVGFRKVDKLKVIHLFNKKSLEVLTVKIQMLDFITSIDNTFARQVVAVEFKN
jgi:hypothetical protein